MPERKDLSSAEFAEYVGKSVSTVCKWAREGHSAAHYDRFSGEWRWIPEEYDRYIKECEGKPQMIKRGRRSRYGVITGVSR